MSENKTQPTKVSVTEFLQRIEDSKRHKDSLELVKIMQEITKEKPVMWGPSIVGFGSYHYTYDSGREGDSPRVGFAPRKAALVIYGVIGYSQSASLLDRLGPHSQGKGCLYVKDLDTIDTSVLRAMIKKAYFAKDK